MNPECITEDLRQEIRNLRSEVDCRIEHGAESGGHLEYVRKKLDEILYPEVAACDRDEDGFPARY